MSCVTTSPGSVRMLQVGLSDSFDMSVTDSDGAWTFSPYMQHVRAVSRVDDVVEGAHM